MAQTLDPVPVCPDAPGVSKKLSPLAVGNRWIDSDKVLFVDGKPQKMPGWVKASLSSAGAPVRGFLWWSTLQLLSFFGAGTYRKLYVIDDGQDYIDITPVESTGTLSDPFTVASGSDVVTVTHTDHGRHGGDEVRFSGASEITGTDMTIDGAYIVDTVVDDDNYTIVHSSLSTGDNTGGGSVSYEYELPVGTLDPLEGNGYGAGGYGLGDYGAPSEDVGSTIVFEPRIWNLAKGGDLLYANPINGGIYVFDPNAQPAYQRAEPLTNAPTVCRSIFITPERFLFALGVDNDTMNIKWPDQDDWTNWTPGSTSTANSRRLQEGSRIVTGIGLGNTISGVWTDTALYRFQYTGNSFIYNSMLIGTGCGLVSPMALISHLGVAYWMSQSDFLYWGGSGAPLPIPNSEDIREFVIKALRRSGYEFKCNAFFWTRYNYLFWFYVADDATEPGLYVAVSLKDYSWAVGTMERSSGTIGPDQRPVLVGVDGYIYQHEEGLDADGMIMQSLIRRAPLQIAGGTRLGEITGIVTDMEYQVGPMSFEIEMFERINEGRIDRERLTFEPGEDLLDPSIGGRIAFITIRSEALGGDFRLGASMLEVKATGKIR